MSTAAQSRADAARANGAMSHGPVTPEGKARSSRNALSHGLCAKHALVRPEEREEYLHLIEGLRDDIRPEGSLEAMFFDQLVLAAWNLRRAAALEAQLFVEAGHQDLLLLAGNPILQKQIDRIQRHKAANRRDFNNAYRELKLLQKNRMIRRQSPEAVPVDAPPLADFTAYTKRTQPPIPEAAIPTPQSHPAPATSSSETQ
ncbi:MAG: hypothetical protein IANPNBLG_01392 [Bryobacteraceae bacterium]|nr:hypothetical protein [Bryobacteraceae bacterium]